MRIFSSSTVSVLCGAVLFSFMAANAFADGMPVESQASKASGKNLNSAKASTSPKFVGNRAKAEASRKRGPAEALGEFALAKYQYCGRDADCTVAKNGCCDCANGGEEVAINKERREAFRKNFECLYVSCGEVVPTEPCRSAVVSCVDHRCRYVSDESFEKNSLSK